MAVEIERAENGSVGTDDSEVDFRSVRDVRHLLNSLTRAP